MVVDYGSVVCVADYVGLMMACITKFGLTLGSRKIEYCYDTFAVKGGWFVCIRGSWYLQFATLRKALWTFLFVAWKESE